MLKRAPWTRLSLLLTVGLVVPTAASGAHALLAGPGQDQPFRQLDEVLPTPTDVRSPSGAPGHRYWQQQVDYRIDVEIDDDNQHLRGSERIEYTNNSPDTLRTCGYSWTRTSFRPSPTEVSP